jgi:hypothetical protein
VGKKPNTFSKTSTPCDCHWLERAAEDPEWPVEFDERLNEYHLRHGSGQGQAPIYHCPFCGGAAPRSRRAKLFARVHHEEAKRLHELTKSLRTVDEVLATLGKPDFDRDAGLTDEVPERDGKAGQTEVFRTLVYSGKSATADIHVTLLRGGEVKSIGFLGKYVGKPGPDRGPG